MRGARGDTERARGTSTTPPSAARSARRAPAGVSLQASMADPEELHRSGTTSRSGITRWSHTYGETPQALHSSSGCDARPPILFSPPGHGLSTLDDLCKLLI